jgi:hypothetical protein
VVIRPQQLPVLGSGFILRSSLQSLHTATANTFSHGILYHSLSCFSAFDFLKLTSRFTQSIKVVTCQPSAVLLLQNSGVLCIPCGYAPYGRGSVVLLIFLITNFRCFRILGCPSHFLFGSVIRLPWLLSVNHMVLAAVTLVTLHLWPLSLSAFLLWFPGAGAPFVPTAILL